MSFILEGTINGMRPVKGKQDGGKRDGMFWHFLSLEVCDPRFGQVYSCQVRQNEKQLFEQFIKVEKGKDKDGQETELSTLKQDWTGHNVKVLVKGVSAGVRKVEDKESKQVDEVLQVRFYVSALKDLGLPKTDDF